MVPPGEPARQASSTGGGPGHPRRVRAALAAAVLAAALVVVLPGTALAAAVPPARHPSTLQGDSRRAGIAHHEAGWLLAIVGALGAVALVEVALGVAVISRRRTGPGEP